MLKDFNIQKYLDKKPPSDNSTTTKGEIIELTKIPIREKFVKEKMILKSLLKKLWVKMKVINQ